MEHVVYHFEQGEFVLPPPLHALEKKGFRHKLSKFLLRVSRFLALVGIILLLAAFLPSIVSRIQSIGFGSKENFKLTGEEVNRLSHDATSVSQYTPPFDPKLPKENRLSIKAIGVDTAIQEATYDNYEAALKKGVWRVSDFGAPGETGKPMILAAHRYGYLAWTNSFRRFNSFLNLPKLKEGDLVEISWQQHKYVYAVYGESKGEEITDYSADLILYTCETLSGPVRIFRYARLLKV